MTKASRVIRQQLNFCSDFLSVRQESILKCWRRRVEADSASALTSHFTREQFVDHFPEVLAVLCNKLAAHSASSANTALDSAPAQLHSQHRWQQGYDMLSLVSEWGHFNYCLVDALNAFEASEQNLNRETMPEARRVLADFIGQQITKGAVEYSQLLQSEAEANLRDLEAGLEHFKKIEQMRAELLRATVHDLNGSLGIVTNGVQLIDNQRMTQEKRDAMKNILVRSVGNLQDMLTNLMDMARLDAGQETVNASNFNVAVLVSELCRTMRPLADARHLTLETSGPADLVVFSDQIKVIRVIQNLTLNAINYTKTGGVKVAWKELDHKNWEVTVADTGPGLEGSTAAPLASRLQEATQVANEVEMGFATDSVLDSGRIDSGMPTHPGSHGEGIGLTIVKKLCGLLGATLALENNNPSGTVFRIEFRGEHNG